MRAVERHKDKIESIILFGSVARGEAKEDSDVDILVIGDVSLEELVDISFPILLEHGKLISAKNMQREHFDFLVREGYSFAMTIFKDGRILYERMGEAFGESGRKTKALLALRDIFPKTHAGVVSQFGLQFVNEGLIEELYAKSLAKVETKREKADYDIYYEPSKEEAESAIEDADAFLKRYKKRNIRSMVWNKKDYGKVKKPFLDA